VRHSPFYGQDGALEVDQGDPEDVVLRAHLKAVVVRLRRGKDRWTMRQAVSDGIIPMG
jgi:hypothetical protein